MIRYQILKYHFWWKFTNLSPKYCPRMYLCTVLYISLISEAETHRQIETKKKTQTVDRQTDTPPPPLRTRSDTHAHAHTQTPAHLGVPQRRGRSQHFPPVLWEVGGLGIGLAVQPGLVTFALVRNSYPRPCGQLCATTHVFNVTHCLRLRRWDVRVVINQVFTYVCHLKVETATQVSGIHQSIPPAVALCQDIFFKSCKYVKKNSPFSHKCNQHFTLKKSWDCQHQGYSLGLWDCQDQGDCQCIGDCQH